MQSITKEYFPTLFYEFTWTKNEIAPLLNEMHEKANKVKERYVELWTNPLDQVYQYWTDHGKNIKFQEYEKLVDQVCTEFLPQLQCESLDYWTAISGETGYHATHQHNGMLYQPKGPDSPYGPNMSSVLYLSSIGTTHFFNPNQSGTADQELFMKSEIGKLVMFPAHVLHRSIPHRNKGIDRYIISSNWLLQESFPGSYFDPRGRDRDGRMKWASHAHSSPLNHK